MGSRAALAALLGLGLLLAPAPARAAEAHAYAFTEASDIAYTLTHWFKAIQGQSHRLTGQLEVKGDEIVLPLTMALPLEALAEGDAPPVATLTLKRIDMAWKTLKEGQAGARLDFKGTAHGEVALNGTRRPITAALEGWALPVDAHLSARFAISPAAHGVPMPRFWFIPFNDRIEFEVEAVARRPAK